MESLDLRDLYIGLIGIVLLSISIGQYDPLRAFAKKEFIHSMKAQHTARRGDIEVLR